MPVDRSTTAEGDLTSVQSCNTTIITSDPCFYKDRDDGFLVLDCSVGQKRARAGGS